MISQIFSLKSNPANYDCHSSLTSIFHGFFNISFEAQKYLNNSCSFFPETEYYVDLFQLPSRKILKIDDIICRVNTCVNEAIKACFPNCLPCQNATESEKNIFFK